MRTLKATIVLCLVLVTRSALADGVCGDVTGDDKVRAGDALAVLRAAVGVPVDLQCSCSEESQRNVISYQHALTCGGQPWTNALIDTPSGRTWASDSGFVSYEQGTNLQTLGPFVFIGQPCLSPVVFDGTVEIPAGIRVLIVMDFDGASLVLQFFNNGALFGAGESFTEPFAVLREQR